MSEEIKLLRGDTNSARLAAEERISMAEVKFCVVPGYVISRTDGDRHYVGVGPLARLHGLRPGSYQRHSSGGCEHLTHVAPRYDGNYRRYGTGEDV